MTKVRNTFEVPKLRFRVLGKTLHYEIRYKGETSTRLSTKITIERSEVFDHKTQQIKGNEAKNTLLRSFQGRLDEYFYPLRLQNKSITAKTLLNYVSGKSEVNMTVMEAYRQYRASRVIDVQSGAVTKLHYNKLGRFERTMALFISEHYKVKDIALHELKTIVGKEFESYLTHKKYGNSYRVKMLKHFKLILDYSMSNGWITHNVLQMSRFKTERRQIEYLNEDELQRLYEVEILNQSIDNVRWCFLFACHTGLAYSDLFDLKAEHLHQTPDGVTYINKARNKTNVESVIALDSMALGIIEKFADYASAQTTGKLLPVISNQKTNKHLKEVARLANITRVKLTTHIARKTCATTLLNNGVSLDSVTSALGHTKSTTTKQYYAKTLKETVIKEVYQSFLKPNKQ